MSAPWQELSICGLGSVVTLLVCWQINYLCVCICPIQLYIHYFSCRAIKVPKLCSYFTYISTWIGCGGTAWTTTVASNPIGNDAWSILVKPPPIDYLRGSWRSIRVMGTIVRGNFAAVWCTPSHAGAIVDGAVAAFTVGYGDGDAKDMPFLQLRILPLAAALRLRFCLKLILPLATAKDAAATCSCGPSSLAEGSNVSRF